MFKMLFKKHRPDYWQNYIGHFKKKHNNEILGRRFVVFDTETTGLDVSKDRILSIGAIAVKNAKIDVGDSLELYLQQELFKADTVPIHGLLKEGNSVKISEEEAIVSFLDYIKDSILVAHHVGFDVGMVNAVLTRMGMPKLKNKVLDTGVLYKKTEFCENKEKRYSLDHLCNQFNLKKHDRHTASGDSFLTALVFMKIISHLIDSRNTKMNDLFFNPDRRGLL